jgi:carboxylesterase
MSTNNYFSSFGQIVNTMKKYFNYFYLIIFAFLVSCNPTPIIESDMLDSGQISYAIQDSFQKHLVSNYINNPSPSQLDTPVIIAAHGYTATTFEWDELRNLANTKGTFYVSQVLLGGHGRSYEAFKKSTWEDWQQSIKDEYRKLDSLGFKKIYLAGSSTGAPLIINMVKSGFFANYNQPKGIFLIDPIVVSVNKTLTMVGLLGPVLGYTTVDLPTGEKGKWYVYRPQETLKQLMQLINQTRIDLQNGITLPAQTYMKVFKSQEDDVADPISALLIYKGMKTSNGGKIDAELINSKLHVFTRLAGRENVTPDDIALQKKVFADMEVKMTE